MIIKGISINHGDGKTLCYNVSNYPALFYILILSHFYKKVYLAKNMHALT